METHIYIDRYIYIYTFVYTNSCHVWTKEDVPVIIDGSIMKTVSDDKDYTHIFSFCCTHAVDQFWASQS